MYQSIATEGTSVAIPTHFPIEFSCGHTETKDLSDTPAGKRTNRAFGLGKNFVCSRCFKKRGKQNLERLNQELLADAMAFEQDHDLPALEGSEKQTNWATRIRFDVLNSILEAEDARPESTQGQDVIHVSKQLPHAGWWIDNLRDTSALEVDDLIELISTAVDDPDNMPIETENPF